MKTDKPVDLSKIRTYSIKKRKTKVDLSSFARKSSKKKKFMEFYKSLPKYLAVNSYRGIVEAIVTAHKKNKSVIIGMGAHVIKVGLNPLIIDLMEREIVSGIALNGAGAIHDFEIATLGRTSEDVGEGLKTGHFGMVEETMRDMNKGINDGKDDKEPQLGKLLGEKLLIMKAPFRKFSILSKGAELNIPITVHVAMGTDTIHMSPHLDPSMLGLTTFNDFRLLAALVCGLEGGVYLNIGSAVILPEVFLKALTIARNLGHKVENFTTANMDMMQHYRPHQNVLTRPGGRSYALTGHHEIMIPLLYQAILESM